MSSAGSGPCHLLQLTTKFTRKLAEGSLGWEAYAFSEMIGHGVLSCELIARSADLPPGMVGLEAGESLFTYLR